MRKKSWKFFTTHFAHHPLALSWMLIGGLVVRRSSTEYCMLGLGPVIITSHERYPTLLEHNSSHALRDEYCLFKRNITPVLIPSLWLYDNYLLLLFFLLNFKFEFEIYFNSFVYLQRSSYAQRVDTCGDGLTLPASNWLLFQVLIGMYWHWHSDKMTKKMLLVLCIKSMHYATPVSCNYLSAWIKASRGGSIFFFFGLAPFPFSLSFTKFLLLFFFHLDFLYFNLYISTQKLK